MIVLDILHFNSCLKLLFHNEAGKEAYFVMKSENPLDLMMIQFMHWSGWIFNPLEYEFSPDEENAPLLDVYKNVEYFSKNHIAPLVQKELKIYRSFSDYEKKRVAAYLEILEKKRVYRSFEILKALDSFEKQKGKPGLVLLSSSIWDKELAAEYKKQGYETSFYRMFMPCRLQHRKKYLKDSLVKESQKSDLRRVICLFLKTVAEICGCMYYFAVQRIKSGKLYDIKNFDICAILPGYGRTEWFHDLFWKKEDGKKHQTLALLYGKFEDSTYKTYGYLAERWVTLNTSNHPPYLFSIFYSLWPSYPRTLFRNLNFLLKDFFKGGSPRYYFLSILSLWVEMSKMEALFKTSGAKILWSSIEGIHLPSIGGAIAIKKVGGVSLGTMWSIYNFPEDFSLHRDAIDIWFAWGLHHADILLQSKDHHEEIVISGYPGDWCMKNYLEKAANLRNMWKKQQGFKTVICYYDNVLSADGQHTFSNISEYLKNLFIWLRRRPETLLVVKSKRDKIFESYSESIKELLTDLEDQKKLVYETSPSDLAPGLASDIILGIGLATLPSLLATYGKKVILFDGNRFHERYPIAECSIAFIKRPDEIANVLDLWMHTADKDSLDNGEIAIDPRPNRLDSFADGKSAERINAYIASLIEGLASRLSSAEAIQNTNRRYIEKWGPQKVIICKEFRDFAYTVDRAKDNITYGATV